MLSSNCPRNDKFIQVLEALLRPKHGIARAFRTSYEADHMLRLHSLTVKYDLLKRVESRFLVRYVSTLYVCLL